MSELTASDTQAILGAIQAMRNDMQALTLEVRVNQAKTDEQFNTVRAEFKALNDKVDELRDRQRATDNRLWGFIVALIGLLTTGLIKLAWFDKA